MHVADPEAAALVLSQASCEMSPFIAMKCFVHGN